LTQRLKRIIEPNFERREQYLHDKNQINDEIAAFATDLSTLMYNAEEVPETTLDILGNLKKAMPSFIQEIETTLDSNTPKQEIEDLKFILENLDLLEALPQMFFDIYESVNQEALSVLLGNELIQSYPRCCKIDNNVDINGKLLGVSAEIVREWVRHLEASSFIIDGFVLSLPIGSDFF
jgi:hypothetical protein